MQIIYQRWGLINPEILFCFQPFLRLDAITRAEVEHILLKFSLNGMSIVISSANIEDILTICDRVLAVSYTHLDVYKRQGTGKKKYVILDNKEIHYFPIGLSGKHTVSIEMKN